MAELTSPAVRYTGLRLGRSQFSAIAWLRWRIFANSFRRKGGVAELFGRLLLVPFLGALVLLPSAIAGFAAWFVTQQNQLQYLGLVFWGALFLTQLLNLNLGQPGTTFDPTELIRFPLSLRSYVLVRLCFGLLSPANVVVTLMSLAILAGVTVSRPQLWPWTLLATASFALANVLFSRMIFAWVDRWLSTRRAREIFTGLIFAGSLGVQYLNVTYNPGLNHGRNHRVPPQSLAHMRALYRGLHPWLQWLPPDLSGATIVDAAHRRAGQALECTALVFLYAGLFLAVYALRMRTEFHGENLSDQANAVPATVHVTSPAAVAAFSPVQHDLVAGAPVSRPRLVPASLAPILGKEFLTLRRNTGLLYGIIAPMVMVFLFAGRMSLRGGSQWVLLLAVGYALLGLAPMSYNTFGLEGPGAQFYFMAPVPLRDVFFAKNVMHFLLAMFDVLAVIGIVAYISGRPHTLDVVFVLLWAGATLLLNTSLGNLRSVSAPKKVNPGKAINRAQSQLSVWIALGVLASSAALAFGFQFLGMYLHLRWLAVALCAALALVAVFTYSQGLRSIERYALDRRETLFEELGKKA